MLSCDRLRTSLLTSLGTLLDTVSSQYKALLELLAVSYFLYWAVATSEGGASRMEMVCSSQTDGETS